MHLCPAKQNSATFKIFTLTLTLSCINDDNLNLRILYVFIARIGHVKLNLNSFIIHMQWLVSEVTAYRIMFYCPPVTIQSEWFTQTAMIHIDLLLHSVFLIVQDDTHKLVQGFVTLVNVGLWWFYSIGGCVLIEKLLPLHTALLTVL